MALLRKEDVESAADGGRGEMGAVLGRGSRFEGKLSFEGTVRIDGEFAGEVDSDGHLIIGPDARVDGTITVASATVSGTLSGTITTRGTLELKRTARVSGELAVESLTVEKGAFFEGSVQMKAVAEPTPLAAGGAGGR